MKTHHEVPVGLRALLLLATVGAVWAGSSKAVGDDGERGAQRFVVGPYVGLADLVRIPESKWNRSAGGLG